MNSRQTSIHVGWEPTRRLSDCLQHVSLAVFQSRKDGTGHVGMIRIAGKHVGQHFQGLGSLALTQSHAQLQLNLWKIKLVACQALQGNRSDRSIEVRFRYSDGGRAHFGVRCLECHFDGGPLPPPIPSKVQRACSCARGFR